MSDIRLVRALSKEFWLLLEVDEVDDVDDVEEVARSEKRELVLCKLEINMWCNPFRVDCPGFQWRKSRGSPSYLCGLHVDAQ
jgi:hypothetical protein